MPQDSQDSNPDKAKRIWERFDFLNPPDPKEAPKDRLVVVELPLLQRPEPPDTELKAALAALPFNVAFDYLMKKFRFQRAVIDSQLKGTRHKTLEDVQALQAQSAALAWLEAQVRFETQQQERERKPATPHEIELFNQIRDTQNVLE